MKTYAIIGAAGYIAPRHMRAIQATGGKIVAACDTSDSVGILDSFGYDIPFFTSTHQLWGFLRRTPTDYVVICTPNADHNMDCFGGMQCGCDVICEKPLTLSTVDLGQLQAHEAVMQKRVHPVLQLRYHQSVQEVRDRIAVHRPRQAFLAYHTPRGPWYDASWKGDDKRSGGILFNIGIHMFDYLIYLFGPVTDIGNTQYDSHSASGELSFDKTHIDWALKISVPDFEQGAAQTARLLIIDDYPIDFTEGFDDLHTKVYGEILAGRGLTSEDTRPSIQLIEQLKDRCTEGGSA